MLRMVFETRVVNLAHLLLLHQPLGYLHRIFAVLFHAHRQCFDPAQAQPRVKWAQDATHRLLQEPELLGNGFVTRDNESPKHVTMAVQVFC